MQFHTFTNRHDAQSARDFIRDNGNRSRLIKIADGWLVMEFFA